MPFKNHSVTIYLPRSVTDMTGTGGLDVQSDMLSLLQAPSFVKCLVQLVAFMNSYPGVMSLTNSQQAHALDTRCWITDMIDRAPYSWAQIPGLMMLLNHSWAWCA